MDLNGGLGFIVITPAEPGQPDAAPAGVFETDPEDPFRPGPTDAPPHSDAFDVPHTMLEVHLFDLPVAREETVDLDVCRLGADHGGEDRDASPVAGKYSSGGKSP